MSEPTQSQERIIALPNGFQPHGIALGPNQMAFVGSSGNGGIYRVNLLTGEGGLWTAAQTGQALLGLAYDLRTNWLYAAGGASGNARLFDATSGAHLRDIRLSPGPDGLVQEVAVTFNALYFTNALRPTLYRMPLTPRGRLPEPLVVQPLALAGDFVFVADDLNANGIAAGPDGRTLIVIHTALGLLYRVDALTGAATVIDLGGVLLKDSSGLALQDGLLYVVNFNNRLYVVELDSRWRTGRVRRTIASRHFDNPSAVVVDGGKLTVVNARVATEALPGTAYWLTQMLR